jgi:hypothetical protein
MNAATARARSKASLPFWADVPPLSLYPTIGMVPGVVLSNPVSHRLRTPLAESLSWDRPDPNVAPGFGGAERLTGPGGGTEVEGGNVFPA